MTDAEIIEEKKNDDEVAFQGTRNIKARVRRNVYEVLSANAETYTYKDILFGVVNSGDLYYIVEFTTGAMVAGCKTKEEAIDNFKKFVDSGSLAEFVKSESALINDAKSLKLREHSNEIDAYRLPLNE